MCITESVLKCIFPKVLYKSLGVDSTAGRDIRHVLLSDAAVVSMVATYTHGNSLMTSDRPETLPEGQDTATLTRADPVCP